MVLDSNILIHYLNGDSDVVVSLSEWKRQGRSLFISSISVAEVLGFASLSSSEIIRAREFLAEFVSILFDDEIAEHAAFCRREYKLSLADSGIASTAIYLGVPVVSRDKQFHKIRQLTIVEI